jgi:protein tyrosine/serine phosphatase
MKLLVLMMVLSMGCTKTGYTHGVPNLVEVEPGVWRSGQPCDGKDATPCDQQWAYLKSLGIKRVVKLNFQDEGTDDGAGRAGLEMVFLPMQPAGDKDVFDNALNTFVHPRLETVDAAVKELAKKDGVLVHCTHGQDRTGLIVGVYRVETDGWTKDKAYAEMLQRGFHPALHGLHEFWEGLALPTPAPQPAPQR